MHIYHRIKDWVSYKDTWNLDFYLDEITYKWLVKFNKVKWWYPYWKWMTQEKWDNIVQEMIEWFRLASEWKWAPIDWINCDSTDLYYTEDEVKKIKKARMLFNKYRGWLWR